MLSLFQSKNVEINHEDIIKEGWLNKESRFMKRWRE
jgi:hypothetical protein